MYCYSLLVINYIYLYVHCFNLVDRDECNSVLPLGGIYLNSFETLFIFLIGCDDSCNILLVQPICTLRDRALHIQYIH